MHYEREGVTKYENFLNYLIYSCIEKQKQVVLLENGIKVKAKQSTWYSLMNMRQLRILFNWAKTWHRIVCWFLCISLFLPVLAWCDHKIVFFWSAEQFYDHIMQELVKTGKYIEINKQSDVKFWLNWIKY